MGGEWEGLGALGTSEGTVPSEWRLGLEFRGQAMWSSHRMMQACGPFRHKQHWWAWLSTGYPLQGDVWICMELMDTSLDKFYRKVLDKNMTIPEDILGEIAVSVSDPGLVDWGSRFYSQRLSPI
jgi:hypothetical protein